MKHRQVAIGRTGLVNSDGHAIGIDIGATSVRAAILTLSAMDGRPSATLNALGSIPLPPGTVVNGVVIDQAALTKALKELWRINEFRRHHVVLGIANPQVVVRELKIPSLDVEQRAKALPFLAKEIVALPMDQVILDFAPLGPADAETNLVTGLLVAAPRLPVLAAVSAVERAGLKVARVDLSSFAVLRSTADKDLAVQAVIDLGAHLTTIVIHHRGIPTMVRTLARGGQDLTERLADRLGLSPDQAEQAKLDTGLIGPTTEVARALGDGIRPLLSEIRSSINYFRSAHDGAQLEGIALTGGASALLGLPRMLSDQNGAPTVVISPMQHVGNWWDPDAVPADRADASASALAVGLAMGTAA